VQQCERVDPGRRRLVRREERADIADPGGSEQRVDQRVRDHVAVRVPCQPARMLEAHTAEHEGNVVRERMRVHAETDAQGAHPTGT
jgi:hypothetical protein